MATGTLLRTWAGRDPYHGSYGYGSDAPPDNNANLSWTTDGQHLAFAYRSSTAPDSSLYLRQVDLSSGGSDLFADSKVIAKIAVSTTNGRSRIWCESLSITGDGRTAVCGADLSLDPPVGVTLAAVVRPAPWVGCAKPTDTSYPGLAEISLATDQLSRVLYQVKPKCMGGGSARVLWASASGNTVLGVVSYTDAPSMTTHSTVILASNGTVTQISWKGAVQQLTGAAF